MIKNRYNTLTQDKSPLGFALLNYNLFVIFFITLLPFRFQWPKHFFIITWSGKFDIITNIILFFPLGFLFQVAMGEKSKYRLFKTLSFGFLVSFSVELAQLFLVGRFSSLIDVITNCTGMMAGSLCYAYLKNKLDSELVGKLLLELPLMNLFYLTGPLLWLNGLNIGNDMSKMYLTPILVFFGGGILVSVWTNRLKNNKLISKNMFSLIIGVWFIITTLPAFYKSPRFFLSTGLVIIATTRLVIYFKTFDFGNARRFEILTIRKIYPLFIIYLLLLAFWPWEWLDTTWYYNRGLFEIKNIPGVIPTLRLLEHMAAFTVLGYMTSEFYGRADVSAIKHNIWIAFYCILTGIAFEVISGFHPLHLASTLRFIISILASFFGCLIYRLQLKAIQDFLKVS